MVEKMPRVISENLFCEFSQEEIEEKGKQLSETMLAYDEVESQKKDATREFASQLKTFRSQMRGISLAIKRKGETRPVDCIVKFHVPEIGTKRIVRTDTGEVVREEAMTPDERQENLFGEISELEKMYGDESEKNPPETEDGA